MKRSAVKGIATASLILGIAASGCATSGDIDAARNESREALRVANEANAKASAAAAGCRRRPRGRRRRRGGSAQGQREKRPIFSARSTSSAEGRSLRGAADLAAPQPAESPVEPLGRRTSSSC